MIWLKLLHIAAIAVWSAGLVCLPALYVQRHRLRAGPPLHRLQRVVRFLYVAIVSPAAFIAIASGTALIFVREPYQPWFSAKLALVGLLVIGHVVNGLVIVRLFEAGNTFPVWRFIAVTTLTLLVVIAILALVLAKPELGDVLPTSLGEPGGLRRLLGALNPFPRS